MRTLIIVLILVSSMLMSGCEYEFKGVNLSLGEIFKAEIGSASGSTANSEKEAEPEVEETIVE